MAKLLKTMTRTVSVGIWDNCTDVIRVYEDRTIAHIHEVRWVGSTGSLHVAKHRIDGGVHNKIVLAAQDDCDDTAFSLAIEAAVAQDMRRMYA